MDIRSARTIERARLAVDAMKRQSSSEWLASTYRKSLYGGWVREDGSEAPPHKKAIKFHESAKSLYCHADGTYLGQIGSDRMEKFTCALCGSVNEIPPATEEPGDWLLSGPSFSKHFPLTLNPYFEEAMGDMIVDTVKNQQKVTTMYVLSTGDRVHGLSYEQYLKVGRDQTNPFEGPRWKGALFDEPPPREVWIATKRGLLKWQSKYTKAPFAQVHQTSFIGGGNQSSKSYTSRSEFCANIRGERPWDKSLSPFLGRAIFACTPLTSPWLYHEIYRNAWNRGGSNRSIFAIEFDITDNPALTDKAIAAFSEGLSPEEKEARLHGRFKHLSGRIFTEFDAEVHVYEPSEFSPLNKSYDPLDPEASEMSVIMSADPHPRKPWFMLWVAIGADDRKYVVDEWPNEDFFAMKNSSLGLNDYAEVIADKEVAMPGGSHRVLWREFDPNMSRTPKTVADGSTTLVQEMEERGYYFESDVNDSISFGHSLIHTLLRWNDSEPLSAENRPMLYISSKCRNLLYAMENYMWDDRYNQDPERAAPIKPKDLGKDPIDALRYCLAREQSPTNWREALSGHNGHYESARQDLQDW